MRKRIVGVVALIIASSSLLTSAQAGLENSVSSGFSDVTWNRVRDATGAVTHWEVSGYVSNCTVSSRVDDWAGGVRWGGCGDFRVWIIYRYVADDGQIKSHSTGDYENPDLLNGGLQRRYAFDFSLPPTAIDFLLMTAQATCNRECTSNSNYVYPECDEAGCRFQDLTINDVEIIDAETFAAMCNDDGSLAVADDLTIDGGFGDITECVISIATDTTLTIQGAVLRSESGSLIIGSGLSGSRVLVLNSTISMHRAVQLSPGCCAGKGEPDRSEADAYVAVINSTITGESVEISGSTADDRGNVVVLSSTIRATASLEPASTGLVVRAGDHGRVTISDSKLISDSGINDLLVRHLPWTRTSKSPHIALISGMDGQTAATGNVFVAPADRVSIRGGGSCTSTLNVPSVSCTPYPR